MVMGNADAKEGKGKGTRAFVRTRCERKEERQEAQNGSTEYDYNRLRLTAAARGSTATFNSDGMLAGIANYRRDMVKRQINLPHVTTKRHGDVEMRTRHHEQDVF